MAKKLFVIGIGGTGMRCLEAFVHTAAVGMYDDTEIEMLALDTDEHNGNFRRLRDVVGCYNAINGGTSNDIRSNTFFSAKINYNEFSPGYSGARDTGTFKAISDYNTAASHHDPAQDVVDLFMDPNVMEMNLEHGYRAQTQMGSMLMYHAIIKGAYEARYNKQSPARNDLQKFLSALNGIKNAPVFIFGSVFGGTGASSIPIIPLAFKRATEILFDGNVDVVANNYFGTIILTNYFKFDINSQSEKVVAKSENFAINSQAALMFYDGDNTVKQTYKKMYLLGRSESESRDVLKADGSTSKGDTGGAAQENPADYIELIAALAAYDFFKKAYEDKPFAEEKVFSCIGHNYGTAKLDFPLFAQKDADIFRKKLGLLGAAAILDLTTEYFFQLATDRAYPFPNVDVGGEAFKKIREYFNWFFFGADKDNYLVRGWLPQMYESRGGNGILFAKEAFECKDLKSLKRFKLNEKFFAGDNPPKFAVGVFSSIFDVAKKAFQEYPDPNRNNIQDMMRIAYASLSKLYFNE